MTRTVPIQPVRRSPTRPTLPTRRGVGASRAHAAVRWMLAFVFALPVLLAAPARGQLLLDELPEEARGAEIVEKLGETVEKSVVLTDSDGEAFRVGAFFDREDSKPVVLALVYYDCPIICSVALDRLHQSLRELDYTIGEDFRVLVVSFDPTETPRLAAQKKILYTSGYNRPVTPRVEAGWKFLTGSVANVRALADSVGFRYSRMSNGEYAHPSALIVLSPEGKVTRYLYGLDYPARQVKLSLLDASEGRIAASLGDRVLHFCYRYDPTAGAYSASAMRIMQFGAIVTVSFLAILIGGLLLAERIRKEQARAAAGRADRTPHETGLPAGAHP